MWCYIGRYNSNMYRQLEGILPPMLHDTDDLSPCQDDSAEITSIKDVQKQCGADGRAKHLQPLIVPLNRYRSCTFIDLRLKICSLQKQKVFNRPFNSFFSSNFVCGQSPSRPWNSTYTKDLCESRHNCVM